MPFPTTPILDNFNRGDSALLGANWTEGDCEPDGPGGTGFAIVSNTANNNTGPTNSASARWNVGTFGPESEAYATVLALPTNSGDRHILSARIVQPGSATFDGYGISLRLTVATLEYRIIRWDNGVRTDIATGTATGFVVGDGLGLEIIGPNINVYRRAGAVSWIASPVLTVVDSTHTAAGYLLMSDSITGGFVGAHFDDLGGGTRVSPVGGIRSCTSLTKDITVIT